MRFKKLSHKDKSRLFQFIAHLAILAGREMSEETYADYNDVVMDFLNNVGLIDELMAIAVKIKSPNGFSSSGRC